MLKFILNKIQARLSTGTFIYAKDVKKPVHNLVASAKIRIRFDIAIEDGLYDLKYTHLRQ